MTRKIHDRRSDRMAHMFPLEHETELGSRVFDDILAVIYPHLLRRYSMQIKYGENTSHRVMKLIRNRQGGLQPST